MNFTGLLTGIAAFLMIGLFHPVVVKMEYHLGKKCWWMLFFPGLVFLGASFFLPSVFSILSGCLAFSLFWSTHEIFLQHKRVLRGQAKMNPERKNDYL